jgi:cobaltochelatase CobS
MFDHGNKVRPETAAKLASITSVDADIDAIERSALKQLSLWLHGPDAGGANIGEAISTAINDALRDVNGLNESQIKDLIRDEAERVVRDEFTQPPRELVLRTDTGSKTLPAEARHSVFDDVLMYTAQRESVYLVGPAGSGKTTLAKQVANAVDLPFYSTGALVMKHELEGFIDPHGNYVETEFYKAFKHGGVYLFDEIDGSSPAAVLAFNGHMANGVASFPCGMVERHPDFVVIAAANTYGNGADRQYVGRNQLDAASLDRFAFVEMGYDEAMETELSGDAVWTAHVQRIRAAINELKIRHIVSPRASIKGARMLAAGMDQASVEQAYIWKGLGESDIEKIKAAC